jgi:hypothetical protein
VIVAEGDGWMAATVERSGDPDEAITVRSAGVVRRADVVWVRCEIEDDLRPYPYSHVRPLLGSR